MRYKYIKPGQYIVYNNEDYLAAGASYWYEHGDRSVASQIEDWPFPTHYPSLVIFNIVRDEADDEPYYMSSTMVYVEDARMLLDDI